MCKICREGFDLFARQINQQSLGHHKNVLCRCSNTNENLTSHFPISDVGGNRFVFALRLLITKRVRLIRQYFRKIDVEPAQLRREIQSPWASIEACRNVQHRIDTALSD